MSLKNTYEVLGAPGKTGTTTHTSLVRAAVPVFVQVGPSVSPFWKMNTGEEEVIA